MSADYFLGGSASGGMAATLLANNMDHNILRPFVGEDGRSYVNVANSEQAKLVGNSATLTKDAWIHLDRAIVAAARQRLNAVADLQGAGLTYGLPNGLASTVLQSQTQTDTKDAIASMDGMREDVNDRPEYDLVNLPLPIVHRDFSFSSRELAASRAGGAPLDTTSGELAARKVSEKIESMLIGETAFSYGGGSVYGYKTFPSRLTATVTAPTDGSWVPKTAVTEVLQMITAANNARHYGPFVLYHGNDWEPYMESDYSDNKGDLTLRERLERNPNINAVRSLDLMSSGFDLVLVQMTSDVVRMVNGLSLTTVQWESQGGMKVNFKVMAIMVPQLRADANSNTGIVHASVA